MSVLSTTTKTKSAAKLAKTAAQYPSVTARGARAVLPVGKVGVRLSKPVLKRRARRRAQDLGHTARTVGEVLAVYGPMAATELGLVDRPPQKKTAPRVAAGAVLGASAVYFLEPGSGAEHRKKVTQLVK